MTGTAGYRFEYNLHLIKIPSHLDRESMYTELVVALLNTEVTVSSITKCLNTTICREQVMKCDGKLCAFLIEEDTLNKRLYE